MKIKQKKIRKNRATYIIPLLVLLLLGGISTYLLASSTNPTSTPTPSTNSSTTQNNSPATTEEINDGNATKKNTLENQDAGSESTTLLANITAANQNGEMLQIRVLIEAISDIGKCNLTLTQGSLFKEYSVGVQASASSSTCKGFDINASELGSTGEWSATIKIVIGAQVTEVSQKVIIN